MATDKLVDFDHVTDYISREAAIALTDQHCFETSYDAVWMEEELRELPAADVRPVVRGKWGVDKSGYPMIVCSECGVKIPVIAGWCMDAHINFCPHCGADCREPNLDTTKGDIHD